MTIEVLMKRSRDAARRARAALAGAGRDPAGSGLKVASGLLDEISADADLVWRLRKLDERLDDRQRRLRSLRQDADRPPEARRREVARLEAEIAQLTTTRRDLEGEIQVTLLPIPPRPSSSPPGPADEGSDAAAVTAQPLQSGSARRTIGRSMPSAMPSERSVGAPMPALTAKPADDSELPDEEPAPAKQLKDDAERAFLPATKMNDPEIEEFEKTTGYGLSRGDGGFTLADPPGREMFPMSETQAAELAHIWTPDIARRVEAIAALWRGDLSPAERRRRIQEEVYRNIPEALRDVDIAGPNWISMEGGDPEDFGQRLAAKRLRAFDEVAAAIESGATEREVAARVNEFLEAMLPEIFGLGRIVKEFLMDVAPGLGNIRSIRHLQNDIAEIRHAVETGAWSDAAMASGMAILDAIGIFPGLNMVKGVARGVARSTPYAGRLFAERSVRRLVRQWTEKGEKFDPIDPRNLVGDLLDDLDPDLRKRFLGLFSNRVGSVGERRTFEDLIMRMDPKADKPSKPLKLAAKQVRADLSDIKELPTNTRIFDAAAKFPSEKVEIWNATLGRFAKWLVGESWEVIPGTKGALKSIEIKTGRASESHAQKAAREYFETHPGKAREKEVDGIVNLRHATAEIPIDFLVQDISGFLKDWADNGRIPRDISDRLQLAMRQLKAKGLETVRFEDYVGFLARLSAAMLRDGGEAMRVPMGMS